MENTQELGGIYVLKCPITHSVVYIGQTVNFEIRKQKYNGDYCHNMKMKRWIRKLAEIDKTPIFEKYLLTNDQETKDKVERHLIKKHPHSFNVRFGGLNK